MTYERIAQAKNKTVGIKQTTKAVEKGTLCCVFIAQDAENYVIKDLLNLCASRGLEVCYLDSMKSLGQACGIEVNCAACAIIEDA